MSITMTFSCSVVELCIVQWDSVCVALLNPYCFMQQKKKKSLASSLKSWQELMSLNSV